METHITRAHFEPSVEIYLHLQSKRVRAVKVRSVLAECATTHEWRMIQRITAMTTSYIVVIITATDSITIIINTVISNHQAHQKPYFFFLFFFFLQWVWHGQSVDGDEAVLGYVHTNTVFGSLVELRSTENFSSSFAYREKRCATEIFWVLNHTVVACTGTAEGAIQCAGGDWNIMMFQSENQKNELVGWEIKRVFGFTVIHTYIHTLMAAAAMQGADQ